MRRFGTILLCIGAALVGCAPAAPVAPAPRADVGVEETTTPKEIAAGNRRFALDLYRRLADERPGDEKLPRNLFFSPMGIATAFGPVIAGAEGETRAGIAAALGYPVAGSGLHPAFGALSRGLVRQGDQATLTIANALWVTRQITPEPAFLEHARTHYDAAVEGVDFVNDWPDAAARINAWASEKTRGRISFVVDPRQPQPLLRLMVTNAVYFLADWEQPFAASSQPGPFTLPDGSREQTPIMTQRGMFRHHRGAGFAALDMPYRDPRLSMTVLLPDRRDGLDGLEEQLSPELLDETLATLDAAEATDVEIRFPKLELRTRYLLNSPLAALGMARAFTEQAQFGGISRTVPLAISSVAQSTFLRVDEKGTEAAAVTTVEVIITGGRIQPEPIRFHADRPFLFLIRDRESGTILFIGRIVRPALNRA